MAVPEVQEKHARRLENPSNLPEDLQHHTNVLCDGPLQTDLPRDTIIPLREVRRTRHATLHALILER
jgi:hypothetical protein